MTHKIVFVLFIGIKSKQLAVQVHYLDLESVLEGQMIIQY